MTKHSDMSDVDASGDAARYARLIGQVTGQMQAHKNRGHELLQLRPGQRVLDAGSGTGDDAVALAGRVAPGGQVVALDNSHDLLDEARRRAADAGVQIELRHGDVHALDLPDASFDACRAERLFQHLADPARALAQMARVTRPGGLLLAIDADYDTLSIDAGDRDVTRAIVRRRAQAAPNGWIGRQLPRLFRDAGLELLSVEGVSFTCLDHDLAVEIYELDAIADEERAAGDLAAQQIDAWKAELEERGRTDRFFLASTGYMVLGRKG